MHAGKKVSNSVKNRTPSVNTHRWEDYYTKNFLLINTGHNESIIVSIMLKNRSIMKDFEGNAE